MDEDYFDRLTGEELISLSGAPADKNDCIEYLLDIVDQAGRVTDRDQALEDLLERERQTTTGVGKKIAIPHAKTSGVDRPTVAFTRSDEGIDFGAMDGTDAHLIFMLLFPEESDKRYLKMLSTLSRALMHDDVRQALLDAETEEDVIATLREAVTG